MINFELIENGAPIVNDKYYSHVVVKTSKIVAFEIDLKYRHCEIEAECYGEGLLELVISLKKNTTIIRFLDYKDSDWKFFAVDCSKYTLRVVFVKND